MIQVIAKPAGKFALSLFEQCRDDKCTSTAAALTYTTLLALVPLFAIMLRILQAMPVFPEMVEISENLLIETFSPDIFSSINEYLITFANKASKLANISIFFFLVTAILTIETIDTALNGIWHVGRHRTFFITILNYLAILIFAPLMLTMSLGMTTYIITLPYVSETLVQTGLMVYLIKISPMLFSSLMFFLIYKLVPNAHVSWKYALVGAIIAALLFEMAKRLFALYLTWFPTFEIIYGSLAIFPVSLLWIYTSWLIVLIGAEITWIMSEGLGQSVHSGSQLIMALQILRDMKKNRKKLSSRYMHKYGGWNSGLLYNVLHLLRQHGIISRNLFGKWELARDLATLNLYELYRICGSELPEADENWTKKNTVTRQLAKSLQNINKELKKLKSVKVAGLLEPDCAEQNNQLRT